MFRNTGPLIIVLLLVASDPALGGRYCRCRRSHATCCCAVRRSRGTNYCLQDVFMHFQNGPDLYDCITYDTGCPIDGYPDLWSGSPQYPNDLPQSCDNHDCESQANSPREKQGPPGHGHDFKSKPAACRWIARHYPGGAPPNLDCNYYELPQSVSNLSQDYSFVMIPAPAQHPGRLFYFGVQTRKLNLNATLATFANCQILHNQNGNGKVLSFDCTRGGQTRTALIWLK